MSAAEKQEGDGGDGARKNVLVGVTGSVAAIKLVELVGLLSAVTEPKVGPKKKKKGMEKKIYYCTTVCVSVWCTRSDHYSSATCSWM